MPPMAVRDPGALSLMDPMDFKPLSLLCQGSALAMRLQIYQWLGKKKEKEIKEAEENKREINFTE